MDGFSRFVLESKRMILQRDEVDTHDHDEGADELVFVEFFFKENSCE
jgi:hypothetical protein